MSKLKKLNLGASPIWEGENDWVILDHKIKRNTALKISGNATNIKLRKNSCSVIFCSHVFEHIPHIDLPSVIAEFNRILVKNGTLRLLTPDLEKITKAYAKKDKKWFKKAILEDENIRTDLGLGGMLMNFIVSPGQDTILVDRNLSRFIAGYAHLYLYDYDMLSKILKVGGFKVRKAKFNDSKIKEMKTPLHVKGLKKKWQNLNKNFYKKNKLLHKLINGKYKINFKVKGFDRDPITSLIIEAQKKKNVSKSKIVNFFNKSKKNYNIYSYSLLHDKSIIKKLSEKKINYKII